MAASRRADVTWTGDLATGSGAVTASTSGAFSSLPVSWAARTESSDGRTSPEELVAAAHASCYAMAFSGRLGRAGTPPQRLDVSATVTFDKLEAGWKVVSSRADRARRGARHQPGGLRRRGRGGQGRLPDQRRPGGQRRAVGRGDPRGLTAGARGGCGATRRLAAGRPPGPQPMVSSRRGLATVMVSISASLTPASRRRGRNVVARYV